MIIMDNSAEKIAERFKFAEAKFRLWLVSKPTGTFSLKMFVSQGSLRGQSEVSIKEKL